VDGQQVRIAVYDQYWSTLGGGEQFAGGIAAALADHHDVTLIGPEPVDTVRFAERLGIDLAGLPLRRIDQESDVSVLSVDYDVLVNCTYQSTAVNRARHGIYVVHFPGEVAGERQRRKDEVRRRFGRRFPPTVVLRSGFYQPDRRGGGRRTDGAGLVDVYAATGAPVVLTVRAEQAAHVELWDGRTRLAVTDLDAGHAADLSFAASGARPQQIVVQSDTFRHEGRPGVLWRYGVTLEAVTLGGVREAAPPDRLRTKLLPPDRLGHLASYDTIASNSQFTAAWVERLWRRPSEVLYPPVRMVESGGRDKERILLNVGRFFDPRRGHSKKQLELVQAFRRLHESAAAPGWRLHLVGGCSAEDRDYAMAVKREALGLPVQVHFSAPGAVLNDLLARGSIYWHAGGLGEDPSTHPDRFEHFGISVVEAMSAGLVPVVFGAAGPAEVVRDGIDGLHFGTLDELVQETAALIGDEPRRRALAAAASTRAVDFGPAAFRTRLDALIAVSGARSHALEDTAAGLQDGATGS
jgi:glycosyltransferase involved in cell wall biosynthesis